MEMIVANLRVNGSVQFDTGDFMTEEFMALTDVVDGIVLDNRINASQMTDHTILPAIVQSVVAYYMRPNRSHVPSVVPRPEHSFQLGLIPWLAPPSSCFVISSGVFLSQANGTASSIVDIVVFDDPAFCPVRANQTNLITSRRGPRTSRAEQPRAGVPQDHDPGTIRRCHELYAQVIHAMKQ